MNIILRRQSFATLGIKFPLPDKLKAIVLADCGSGSTSESIEEALAHLKERESKILRLYFGLDGEEPMTLEQIGSLLGITRERVRQLETRALRELRIAAPGLEHYLRAE